MGREWRGAAQSRSLIKMESKGYYMYCMYVHIRVYIMFVYMYM